MKIILSALGVVIVILSIPIGALTPFLPVGLPLTILGIVLIGRNSRWGKRLVVSAARWNPRTRKLYRLAFRRMPGGKRAC